MAGIIPLIDGRLALQPGDHLIYGKSAFDLIDTAICVKTWSDACNIEIYAGELKSVASRNGIGVNLYDLRLPQLIHVLRPRRQMDMERAMKWFNDRARGQAYDWKGLLCFTLAVKQGSKDKMFCSEFAARFDRHGRLYSFNPKWDADKIAPSNFLMSPAFNLVWSKPKHRAT